VADAPEVSDRIWTVPNILSFLRLAMVPVFFVLVVVGQDLIALVVIVVSTVTDYLDGVIARRWNQITRLGQLIDPAADRLFIFASVIALAVRGAVPWWLVIVLVGRDVFILGLGIVLARHGYGPLPVHHLGKMATLALFYALPILVLAQAFPVIDRLALPIGWAFALWGAFLYWWAGIVYAIETRRVVAISARTGATASDTLDA
jgi:cardiolipin synthase